MCFIVQGLRLLRCPISFKIVVFSCVVWMTRKSQTPKKSEERKLTDERPGCNLAAGSVNVGGRRVSSR